MLTGGLLIWLVAILLTQTRKRFMISLLKRKRVSFAVGVLAAVGMVVAFIASSPASFDARDRELIERTYVLAVQAKQKGESPFGALLLHDGQVIHEAENDVTASGDPTHHAEHRLVVEALDRYDADTVRNSTLYTSTEPCNKCERSIHAAGIRTVVYGTSAWGMRNAIGKKQSITLRGLRRKLGFPFKYVGPVLEAEGMKVHVAHH